MILTTQTSPGMILQVALLVKSSQVPQAKFSYDLSPVEVVISYSRRRWFGDLLEKRLALEVFNLESKWGRHEIVGILNKTIN